MQTVVGEVKEAKKTDGCFVRTPVKTPVVTKVKELETEVVAAVTFGDLDDMVRVARYKVHELCYALPATVRRVISDIESHLEVLSLKGRAPAGFGIAEETPPILSTIEELEETLRMVQGPELTEAKKRYHLLMDEKEFILQKNKK